VLINRRRMKRIIDDYEKHLGGANNVASDQAIACHRARLVLESDLERRIRSMQTLAALGSKAAITNAVRDLPKVSRKWPRRGVRDEELAWLLLMLLRETVTSCK
jgi:hypothetical protein